MARANSDSDSLDFPPKSTVELAERFRCVLTTWREVDLVLPARAGPDNRDETCVSRQGNFPGALLPLETAMLTTFSFLISSVLFLLAGSLSRVENMTGIALWLLLTKDVKSSNDWT